MSEHSPAAMAGRSLLFQGDKVGLALMRREDVPTFARCNPDLAFTASIGTPGEAHTLEMRQEAFGACGPTASSSPSSGSLAAT